MAQSASIRPNQSLPTSMDYEALYQEGLALVQQFSAAIWTDYNQHDPGVTILEYLCFGLTDLGYRADFPVVELLYAADKDPILPENNAFFSPEEILPSAAMTIYDYRRLILANQGKIHNVWVNPVDEIQEKIKGLYDIQLQLNDENAKRVDPIRSKRELLNLLAQHRNLTEDFRFIHILEEEYLGLNVELELHQDGSAEQILAKVIHALDHLLNPKIKFQDFNILLAEGANINTLLDGPMPNVAKGYIDPNDLHHLPMTMYKSQIQNTISAIPGIRSVKKIEILRNGFPHPHEEITLPINAYLVLDKSLKDWQNPNYPIVFIRNNFRVKPNPTLSEQNYKILTSKDLKYFTTKLNLGEQIAFSTKKMQEIGEYHSIQRFFPNVYGIGHIGLSPNAKMEDKVKVLQLKGYLAIFESLLSSFLKQLTQLKQFFYIESLPKPITPEALHEQELAKSKPIHLDAVLKKRISTNFQLKDTFEFPYNIPDIKDLVDEQNLKAVQAAKDDQPQHLVLRFQESLDHLLARFGESYHSDWLHAFSNNPNETLNVQNSLINSKYRILVEYPELSRNRGLGFNYRQVGHVKKREVTWGDPAYKASVRWTDNVSGLKKRLCYWLNLLDYSDHEITPFFPFEQYAEPTPEAKSDKPQQSIPFDALMRYGQIIDHYSIETYEDQYGVFFKGLNQEKYGPLFVESQRNKAEHERQHFTDTIHAFDQFGKTFFVLEHILLRPVHEPGKKMVISVNKLPASPPDPNEPNEPNTPNDLPVFQSIIYSNIIDLQSISEDLIAICSDARNYERLAYQGQYFIVINQDDYPILISQNAYPNDGNAKKMQDESIKRFLNLLRTSSTLKVADLEKPKNTILDWGVWRRIESKPPLIEPTDRNFFASKISLFVPNWPSIFLEDGFKPIFQQMLIQHIPAHIHADVYWLDWGEMAEFEKLYFNWLEIKSDVNASPFQTDISAAQLIKLLNEKNGENNGNAPNDPNALDRYEKNTDFPLGIHDSLGEALFEAIFVGDKRYRLLKPTDLLIIEGIDQEIEYFLKRGKIDTWHLLLYADTNILQQLLSEAGKDHKLKDIENWQEQVNILLLPKSDRPSPDFEGLKAFQEALQKQKPEGQPTQTAIELVIENRKSLWTA